MILQPVIGSFDFNQLVAVLLRIQADQIRQPTAEMTQVEQQVFENGAQVPGRDA